jgi:hypothetical protein
MNIVAGPIKATINELAIAALVSNKDILINIGTN